MEKLILATRSSPLALWQANHVAGMLKLDGCSIEILPVETSGDAKLDVSLSKIGEKGLFTKELETLLIEGRAHLAVHSAKDMPSQLPDGLRIIAFSERENPADVVVSFKEGISIHDAGIKIGTSSTRRVAMLKRYVPTSIPVPVRGNLQTRFRKMKEGECDAMILAKAGVVRMGFDDMIREELATEIFTPAAGQASLAIEISENLPAGIRKIIRERLNHSPSESAIIAERAFLRKMEGGCSIPVFTLCKANENGFYQLLAGIISPDGSQEIRFRKEIQSGEEWNLSAFEMAGEELAISVLEAGGAGILQKIKNQ